MVERDKEWDFHFRTLSSMARDSNFASDPASDPSLLNSVKKLHELCKAENSEDLIARVYPQLNKIFQRSVASISQSRTSNGLLLLAILQFFLDFGEVVLHDADPSLSTFFRSCLSREFADAVVAEATLEFLNLNKRKLLTSFPTLLPQFFPLMLKLIAWNGEKLEKLFLIVFPSLMSPGSFLPLFPSLVDLPILVVALEKVERSSGSLIGSSIASLQKSVAPEMLLALMDEAYTGSTIGDEGPDFESEDSNTMAVADPLFLELLQDENDGLAGYVNLLHPLPGPRPKGILSRNGASRSNVTLGSPSGDVPRVDGQLAVARAFGDKSLKKHLSSEPDVFSEIVDEDTEFIILASDGIWKVASSRRH